MKTEKVMKSEINPDELVIEYSYKPQFAVTTIIIDEMNDCYAINGSDIYHINLVEELYAVIEGTPGNYGWYAKCDGVQHIETLNRLHQSCTFGYDDAIYDYTVDPDASHIDMISSKLYLLDWIGSHEDEA